MRTLKLVPAVIFGLSLVGCTPPAATGGDPGTDPTGTVTGTGTGTTGTSTGTGGQMECFEGCDGSGSGSGSTTPVPPDSSLSSPIDPTCMLGQPDPSTEVLVAKWPTLPPTVPDNCLVGFEINELEKNSYAVSSAAGSRAITLEVDIATYTAADHVRIVADMGMSTEKVLIDTCRLRTATYADPTGGQSRPPEDSIRDFRVDLPAGSKTVTIDNSGAATPTYVRILGLCDFSLVAPATLGPREGWRKVTSR